MYVCIASVIVDCVQQAPMISTLPRTAALPQVSHAVTDVPVRLVVRGIERPLRQIGVYYCTPCSRRVYEYD